MKLTDKDYKVLASKPNSIIDGVAIARARLVNMPESILNWYEENKGLIKAKVVVVRSGADEAEAVRERNSSGNTLFVFGCDYHVDRYFSGTSRLIELSNALLKRAV